MNMLINEICPACGSPDCIHLINRVTMETTAKKIKEFISSVIKQREKLINENLSHKNKLEMVNSIEFLKTMLEANQFSTDRLMADFFKRHSSKVLILLPGEGSKDYEGRQKEFEEIENLCNTILT